VIYVGSKLFLVNQANAGDISAFIIYMSQILFSLIMITNVFNMLVRTKASTARIKEVFDCEEDYEKSKKDRKLNGRIIFDHVTFAYPNGGGLPAVNDLSFSVNPGESLAIIGPTGSGKSTIAWLLLRFYDTDSGRILLDDYEIKILGADEIRNNIAIAPQKAMLFSGSVAENLRWGDMNATKDELHMALQKAQADFVMQMQEGSESILGSGGVNISGGQKQRISIARGIVKKSPILILDDATSALDAVTEAKVQENLRSKESKQTLITITQRCGTAMYADKILVMENGKKMGIGTHKELMETCEVYQDIYRTQIESGRGE
ncbi:MAG: transporter related, partial [Firmicutes bacterium]|nr:transporter related [Bacillota bacterium]